MSLHSPNATRPARITGYVLSAIVSAMLVFSAIMKFLEDDFLVQSMSAINLLPSMQIIALVELLVVILYWIPKTMNLGFLLCCCFLGGIIAGELIAAQGSALPIPGVPLAIMLFIGTYLRKKELFFG